jgi:hypothetical protein
MVYRNFRNDAVPRGAPRSHHRIAPAGKFMGLTRDSMLSERTILNSVHNSLVPDIRGELLERQLEDAVAAVLSLALDRITALTP